jgi:hypothetical protein
MSARARLVLLFAQWIGLAVVSTAALATEPTPAVSIPPAGLHGFPFLRAAANLASFGYTENEFLISGNAQAFVNSGTLGTNGVWNVSPGATAPYTTRILVRAPSNPERFNGTVVVEWLNVSGGIDADPEWDYAHVELLREGYAWVGVTAQFVGAAFLQTFDTVRYASISHPGDSWSYDIYSQAGRAILHGNPQPLGALTRRVRAVLAAGESQSASRMFTYYNAIQPEARVYQGFLIHSTGSGAPLSQSSAAAGSSLGASAVPPPRAYPRRRTLLSRRPLSSAVISPNQSCSSIRKRMSLCLARASASTINQTAIPSGCGNSPELRTPIPIFSSRPERMRRIPAWLRPRSLAATRRSITDRRLSAYARRCMRWLSGPRYLSSGQLSARASRCRSSFRPPPLSQLL